MYDLLVLGGGPGGYIAALRAAQLGAKVALIEKESVGGTCLHRGCIPTKALLQTVHVMEMINNAKSFGISLNSSPEINLHEIRERKNRIIRQLNSGIIHLLQRRGVDVIRGTGQVLNKREIAVGEQRFYGKHLILATGSRPFILPLEGFETGLARGTVITSREALNLEEVPGRLVIIGGGVVGVEMASVFRGLGSKVTIVEKLPGILPSFSREMAREMETILKTRGISVYTGAEVLAWEEPDLKVRMDGKTMDIRADKVLVAAGRIPNLEGLERLSLKMNGSAVWTDAYMQTSIDNVFAVGDINGKYMLAHVAMQEGITAAENIAGNRRRMSYKAVPNCVYTSPELASVGLSEERARGKGYEIDTAVYSLKSSGKAMASGDTTGWVKLVVDRKYKQILGMEIISSKATEMIMEGVFCLNFEVTAEELVENIHPHPTLSETICEAANSILGKPVHG